VTLASVDRLHWPVRQAEQKTLDIARTRSDFDEHNMCKLSVNVRWVNLSACAFEWDSLGQPVDLLHLLRLHFLLRSEVLRSCKSLETREQVFSGDISDVCCKKLGTMWALDGWA
jgi:hypothetical protein